MLKCLTAPQVLNPKAGFISWRKMATVLPLQINHISTFFPQIARCHKCSSHITIVKLQPLWCRRIKMAKTLWNCKPQAANFWPMQMAVMWSLRKAKLSFWQHLWITPLAHRWQQCQRKKSGCKLCHKLKLAIFAFCAKVALFQVQQNIMMKQANLWLAMMMLSQS